MDTTMAAYGHNKPPLAAGQRAKVATRDATIVGTVDHCFYDRAACQWWVRVLADGERAIRTVPRYAVAAATAGE